MPEKVVIIGSGPAGWTAAIYAARANLKPLVFEGAITPENQVQGHAAAGPAEPDHRGRELPRLPRAATSPSISRLGPADERRQLGQYEGKPHTGHGVNGPELMELMRQQAVNFGTRIVTDDIVKVDFSKRPFMLFTLDGRDGRGAGGHRRHRGAGELPRPAVGGPLQEQRRVGVRRLRRGAAALPQQAARGRRRRRLGGGGGDVPDQVRQHGLPGPPPRQAAGQQDHAGAGAGEPEDPDEVEPRAGRGARRRRSTA